MNTHSSDRQPRQPRSVWHRTQRRFLLYVLIPYVAVVTIFTLAQRRLIYHPLQAASNRAAAFGLSSSETRDVTLTTDDGLTFHGWLLFAQSVGDGSPVEQTRAAEDRLLIYFPGNGGHRGSRIADFREFTRHGVDVLIFDYRGYGENPGSPSQEMMQSDARAVWRFAVDELSVDPSRIVLFGESMGGAVAVHLAAELCEKREPPAALITNSTFASLTGTVRWHYPGFPFQYLLWDRWSSVERMPCVSCPVLMFHGARDEIVPLSQGRELFAAARPEADCGCPKRFVELPTNGHNDIPVALLSDELSRLFAQVFPDGRSQ